MKIIIAPDKFKGSLTSVAVCTAIQEGLQQVGEHLDIEYFPMADGGDGFADVLKYYTATVTQNIESVDALGRSIDSSYELNTGQSTAIIELASCSGLAMLRKEERNPFVTSSYGTGLQMQDAFRKGAKKIILGIGGSATNDAGTGILSAMGFRFFDKQGNSLRPCGEMLAETIKIVPPKMLPKVQLDIACDVNNPLHGPEGAAMIFSEQKGATPQQARLLDNGLRHFAEIILQQTGKNVADFPGAGAAGGIAAGLSAFLPVSIREGTEVILSASDIRNRLVDADLVITGEGKIDQQSCRGKAICAITALAKERNIPVVAFCGKLELTQPEYKNLGLELAVEIVDGSISELQSMTNAHALLSKKVRSAFPSILRIMGTS